MLSGQWLLAIGYYKSFGLKPDLPPVTPPQLAADSNDTDDTKCGIKKK